MTTNEITVTFPNSTPALDTDYLSTLTPTERATIFEGHRGRYPYSACSGLLDEDTAVEMRTILLQWMPEAELNSYSVGALIGLYCEFLGEVLEDLCLAAEERTHDPSIKVRIMKAALEAAKAYVERLGLRPFEKTASRRDAPAEGRN
jgi:hypothetical protein